MPAVSTAKNAADGSFSFGAIEFATVGEYTYRIYENDAAKLGGFAYDKSVYTVVVKVTDNGDATLTAEIISLGRDNQSASDIVFENAYDPTDATLQLSGTKQLTGKTIRDGEFEFKIAAVTAGAPMPTDNIVKNIGSGFSFGAITYTKAGKYVYTVTEVDGGKVNYAYDKSVYTVTVTVTDNSEGLLTATYTMTKDNLPASEVYFVNSFIPSAKTYDIYAEFGGEKTLVGRTLRDGEFEFKLINAITGEQIGESVKNDATGKLQFPTLTFTGVGTYHYKISEVAGDENGISYDPVVYHVVIGVAQIDDANSPNDGNLTIVRNELHEAHIVVDSSSGTPVEKVEYVNVTANGGIKFENTYKAMPAEIKLGGKKILAGRALEDGEFTFNLYGAVLNNETGEWEKDALIEQTTNDANGNFEFETRFSDENAEYIYFITEDATNPDPTITYDTKEYIVKIKSTDNLDGTRSLSYEYSIGDTAADEVVFTNTYTAPPPTPDTGDDGNAQRDLWMLMAVAFTSLIGITAASFSLFSKKAEEN
jgi:pilin isopeptide linkage protein